MKQAAILSLAALGPLVSCGEIPGGPARAAAAAARCQPALERDLAAVGMRFGDPVFLRAFKQERLLEVFVRQRGSGKYLLFRRYPIAAASGALGPKLEEGDRQVPEGFYLVTPAAMRPDSSFHLAFNIGYPNEYDRGQGRSGSAIMVHGSDVSIGCLAMTDEKIEEIYTLCAAALRGGQPYFRVHVFPFRMTKARLAAAGDHRWSDFWKNLQEGYQRFEQTRVPPDVFVRGGHYYFQRGR